MIGYNIQTMLDYMQANVTLSMIGYNNQIMLNYMQAYGKLTHDWL